MSQTVPQPRPLSQHLSHLIVEEIANALGLPRAGMHMRWLQPLVHRVTLRFGALASGFDTDVATAGFREAARRFSAHFIRDYTAIGAETVAATGPLIVAANHPGVTDALVIISSLPRDDAKLVISDVPITRALPHAFDRFIHVSGETDNRVHAVREMIRHLRDGGTVVIFPSTHLTPDPAVVIREARHRDQPARTDHDALVHATFDDWSQSILLPLKRVPDCCIQVAIVEGVLQPRFAHHPLTRLIRAPKGWERQRLAEFLQVMGQLRTGDRFGLVPRVAFGVPFSGSDLQTLDRGSAMRAIRDRGAALLEACTLTI